MKFPYGLADFYSLRKEGYFYQDRTQFIHLVEERGKQLVFLRPRRFGKSLWLSTLANYYDLARADDFPMLFGDLAIGQNPTPLHNQHLILRWDFSKVAVFEDVELIVQRLYNIINEEIRGFENRYHTLLPKAIEINPDDAVASFNNLLNTVQLSQHPLYLLIIEFKYVELTKVGLTAEAVRSKAEAELAALDPIKDAFSAARTALHAYRQTLLAKYGTLLKLRVYAVVSLGFERIFWQEVV